MKIQVQRIKNVGRFGEYPALRNANTGRIYVDTTLGIPRFLEANEQGENRSGEFVAFNIPGAWHTFNEEPECPLRREIEFEVVP